MEVVKIDINEVDKVDEVDEIDEVNEIKNLVYQERVRIYLKRLRRYHNS